MYWQNCERRRAEDARPPLGKCSCQLRFAVHIRFGVGIPKGMKQGVAPKILEIAVVDGGIERHQIDVITVTRSRNRRRIERGTIDTRIIATVLTYKLLGVEGRSSYQRKKAC